MATWPTKYTNVYFVGHDASKSCFVSTDLFFWRSEQKARKKEAFSLICLTKNCFVKVTQRMINQTLTWNNSIQTLSHTFLFIWMSYIQTNRTKKIQSPGALNTKVTPGYKKRECKKIMLINK